MAWTASTIGMSTPCLRASAWALQVRANRRAVAQSLRELAETRRGEAGPADLAADRAAEIDANPYARGSAAWPVELVRAYHAARTARPGPPLRIPEGDPRLRIPPTLAPV